jgi:RHS repeat-associated protein
MEKEFMSWAAADRVYADSVDSVCRIAYRPGPSSIYYKGIYFDKSLPAEEQGSIHAWCQATCPECGVGTDHQYIQVYQICAIYHMVDGVKTLKRFSYDASDCELPCDACATRVGNPVEIANFTKVTTAEDWSSPIEPRFRIARTYRSDTAFSSRFEGMPTVDFDLFSNSWQRTYSDMINWTTVNPYDPADTRTWERYETPDGRAIYFLLTDRTQTLGGEGYTLKSSPSGSGRDVTGPDGVVMSFYKPWSTPFALTGIKWPDGYKITIDLADSRHAIGMTDNKGNKATFVFDQNVVPGAERRLISEVVLWRQTPSGYVETGKLIYTYTALSWQPLLANGNPDLVAPPVVNVRQPAITAVDYLEAGATVATPVWRYTYQTSLPPSPLNPDGSQDPVQWDMAVTPMLTSIADGGAEPFAEYTYKYYGHAASGRYLGFGVETEKLAGDPVPTVFDQSGGGSEHVMISPEGFETSYSFSQEERNNKVASIATESTAATLPTETSISYGSADFVADVVNRNGTRTAYTRDAKGRILTMVEDADGTAPRTTAYTWHATLRLPLTRTTEDLLETFTYDATGLLLTYTQKDTKPGSPTLDQTRIWTYGYTTLANGLKVLTSLNGPGLPADGVADVTTHTYTAIGDLITATDPNGLVTTVLARNTFGQPTQVEQPDKSLWSFAYDSEGRVIGAGFSAPGQTPLMSSFAYNFSDQVTSYTNSLGKTWTFTYNDARRLMSSTSPTGDMVTYTYDASGNVTKEEYSNGSGPVTFWEGTDLDGLNRVLRTIGAMGQEWDYSHDVEDNLATLTDPLDHTTSNTYDPLNRLIATIDRENHTTGMDYDQHDRLTEYTDPRTIETSFTYNGFGEVITEVSADRGTIQYTYDRRGLVTSRTDGRGITVTYAYDNGGRLTLIDYPVGGIGDIAFTYDTPLLGVPANSNKGHTARIDDGSIRMDFGHEVTATGPRVTMTALYPAARSYTVVEETDFEGNATRTVYPSGREVLVTYDDANRPLAIRLKDGANTTDLLTQMTYAPNGPLTSALYGDGYTQTRTYDLSYRLTGIEDALGATKLRDVTMGYEGRDNLTSVADLLTPANSESFTYTPRESLMGAVGPYGAYGYTYDGVGNRLTESLGAATDSYSYPLTSNRLTSISLASGVVRGFTYDAAGNVTAEARTGGGTYAYAYNAAGRMESFSINGFLQASYKYDAMGRQAIRTLTSPSPVTIHSVFDSEGRRIAEYDETSGALLREYVWNGWEPIAVIEGGVAYHIRADHIARPVFATDANGAKVWTATYLPFGGVHTSTGALPPARFPGQWFQTESGLHQNWMRDYDPTTGRYLQADPLGLVDGASVYGYTLQNPVRLIDPWGEQVAETAGAAWLCTGPQAAGCVVVAGCVVAGIGAYALYNWIASDDAPPQISTPIDTTSCDYCDCEQLTSLIEALALDQQLRLEDMMVDTNDLYNTAPTVADNWGKGSWEGHQNRHDSGRKKLLGLIALADAKGCPVSAFARAVASDTAPKKPL